MKFTFKTEKPTGRFKAFQTAQTEIKLKKVEVGYINRTIDRTYKVHFKVIKMVFALYLNYH